MVLALAFRADHLTDWFDVSDETVSALGKLSEALEAVEVARGQRAEDHVHLHAVHRRQRATPIIFLPPTGNGHQKHRAQHRL